MRARQISKLFVAATTAAVLSWTPAQAGVHVDVGIALPPPPVFGVVPQLIVLPGTDIYVVPDYAEDIYFVDGWWWRPWHGHWYRSHYYDRDWGYYSGGAPYFYRSVPTTWRTYYREGRWNDRPWNYERIRYDDVNRNWSSWKREGRWHGDRYWREHDRNRSGDTVNETYRRDSDRGTAREVNRTGTTSRTSHQTYNREVNRSAPAHGRSETRSKTVHREVQRSAPAHGHQRMESPRSAQPHGSQRVQSHSSPRTTGRQGGGGGHAPQHSGGGGHQGGGGHSQGHAQHGGGGGPKH